MSSLPNESLPREAGGFLLRRELGRGGMGVVYEAEEIESKRVVALKVLTADAELPPEVYQRFKQEARLAASISDPHCVFVYGAHEIDGVPAIAMELCTGDTFEDRMTAGEPVKIADALRWILEVVDGLEAAHRAGVIHRDMKPSNCFFTEDGHVKVGDFGLSRSTQQDVQLTQAGAFLGSPLFASPEQIRGRAVDVRSDIYSVGATLYALLTGVPPHHGEIMGEVLARILSEEPPPPRSLRPEIPRVLETAILEMLAKNPDERTPDYEKVREALHPFLPKEIVPGGLGRRFAAWCGDSFVIMIVNQTVMYLANLAGMEIVVDQETLRITSPPAEIMMALWPMLYLAFFEGRYGAAFGKWLVGQRVVSVDDLQATYKGATLRVLVLMLTPFVVGHLLMYLARDLSYVGLLAIPVSTGVVLSMMVTFRRRNGYRGIHEFASGTRVIQQPSPFWRPKREIDLERGPIDEAVEVPAELASYSVTGVIGKTANGPVFLGHDSNLQRDLWIQESEDGTTPAQLDSRALQPRRLRWLESVTADGKTYQVFEDPGGQRLVDLCASGTCEWPFASRTLVTLTEELAESPDEPVSLEQLWVDRKRNLRVLDTPVGEASEALEPVEFLSRTARAMLGQGSALPQTLPVHAEPALRKILDLAPPFETIKDARAALARWKGRESVVTRATRVAQLALSVGLPTALTIVMVLFIALSFASTGGLNAPVTELRQLARHESGVAVLDEDGVRARTILVARYYGSQSGSVMAQFLPPEHLEVQERALELYPDPTAKDVEWAYWKLGKTQRAMTTPKVAIAFFIFMAFGCGMCSSLSSFLARGALSFNVFGLQLRTRSGKRASRARCLWRSLVGWLPFAFAYSVCAGAVAAMQSSVPGLVAAGVVALLHALVLIHAVKNPTRSVPDILTGTRIVPR